MTHLAAIERKPSTFGAGTPLEAIKPFRVRVANPIVAPPPEWLAVIDAICAKHRIHRKDMLAGWRSRRAVVCRNEIWRALRASGVALEKIGMMTGGYHHTTVMHGLRAKE